eukprot:3474322-Prymnesium_polylepis.1
MPLHRQESEDSVRRTHAGAKNVRTLFSIVRCTLGHVLARIVCMLVRSTRNTRAISGGHLGGNALRARPFSWRVRPRAHPRSVQCVGRRAAALGSSATP